MLVERELQQIRALWVNVGVQFNNLLTTIHVVREEHIMLFQLPKILFPNSRDSAYNAPKLYLKSSNVCHSSRAQLAHKHRLDTKI